MRLISLTLFTLIILLLAPLSGVLAQDISAVQELHGSLAPGQKRCLS